MEQLYLEQLVVKPMPKKQENIRVKVKMVDKTKEMHINREMILNRLHNKNILQVRKQVPNQIITIKKPKKINETIKIVEVEDEVDEEKVKKVEVKKVEVKKVEDEDEDEEVEDEKVKKVEVKKVEDEDEDEDEEVEDEKVKKVEKVEKVEDEDEEDEELEKVKKVEKVEEVEDEVEEKQEKVKKEPKAKGKKAISILPRKYEINEEIQNVKIGKHTVEERLPKPEKIIIKTSPYYMNNRRMFIQKLREMFKDYSKELKTANADISCSAKSGETGKLMTHQKIVRDYLNLYTPYRGLLLYHALGSGKTSTSIAIAEGMKSAKTIMVLTPASLKMNFFSEIKRFGDPIYRKNQYWEFISTDGKPEYIDVLENVLSLPRETFEKNRGAWMVDVTKEPNFSTLSSFEQESIDEQLNLMIRAKYVDINYNGLTKNKMNALTEDDTKNPFDDKVIIIDEAHNFVSRIVNKIKRPESISFKLYDNLMRAKNARVILLTGTPIINYPNEIGILFNILRGSIKTWYLPLTMKGKHDDNKLTKENILKIFDHAKFKHYDYVEYTDNKLIITRNPFGFLNTSKRGPAPKTKGGDAATLFTSLLGGKTKKKERKNKSPKNKSRKSKKSKKSKAVDEEPYTIEDGIIKINYHPEEIIEDDAKVDVLDRVAPEYHKGGEVPYNGVKLDEFGALTDEDFEKHIKEILKKHHIDIIDGLIDIKHYKALPDDSDSFLSMFVDIETGKMKNENVFKKRILGLTSYFRSAQEKLLPRFVENEDVEENANPNIHVMNVEMSDHQFASYIKIRKVEIDQEKDLRKNKAKQAKKGQDDLYQISSTYRIFSRAACNFTFPAEIERPLPNKEGKGVSESEFDVVPKGVLLETDAYLDEEDIVEETEEPVNYKNRIDAALEKLAEDEEYLTKEGLEKYSPKFVKLLENIQDEENVGLHLIYSQFRTIEGIGILKIILEANGYAEFKIKKNISTDTWTIVEKEGDEGKPRFVLYTGTETAEEKEIIRNIYNSNWPIVPPELVKIIEQTSTNNHYGEIIKLFMITSSGAEGINLKNTRFVHVVEPYWHNVRIEQVIGRARRICSHEELPEEHKTVKVFLYLSVFTETQKTDKKTIEIMMHDKSRIDGRAITTDESLYEISQIKDKINQQILKSIKETAIDCNVYNKKTKGKDDENLVCYGSNFEKIESNDFISYPTLEKDMSEKEELNVIEKKIVLKDTKELNGVKYKINPETDELFDKEIFDNTRQLVKVGELKKVGKKRVLNLLDEK